MTRLRPGEEFVYTWDGSRMMVFSLQNEVPYTVFEDPGDNPDDVELVKRQSRRRMVSSISAARAFA